MSIIDRMQLTYHDIYNSTIDKDYLTKEEFILINRIFFILLSKGIIQKGNIYKFPNLLGVFYVGKRQASKKKKVLNYVHYKQTGELSYKKAALSDNYIAFFKWGRYGTRYPFKMKNTLKFTPVRANKQELTKTIRENNTMHLYTTHDPYKQ